MSTENLLRFGMIKQKINLKTFLPKKINTYYINQPYNYLLNLFFIRDMSFCYVYTAKIYTFVRITIIFIAYCFLQKCNISF